MFVNALIFFITYHTSEKLKKKSWNLSFWLDENRTYVIDNLNNHTKKNIDNTYMWSWLLRGIPIFLNSSFSPSFSSAGKRQFLTGMF